MSVFNCTVANNKNEGLIVGSVVKVRNSILYGNSTSARVAGGLLDIDYSVIQGGFASIPTPFERLVNYGMANTSVDPKFVDSARNDFHLKEESIAINTGNNESYRLKENFWAGTTFSWPIAESDKSDTDGKPRILGGKIDIGCYEKWIFYPINNVQLFEEMQLNMLASTNEISYFGGATFQIVSGPAGLGVDSSSGRLTWTPAEAQGPGVYSAVIRGTAATNPAATDTQTLTFNVQEANLAPKLADALPQSVVERETWTCQLQATDADLPANTLAYRLVSGPAGVLVDSKTGAVSWHTGEADGGQGYDLVFEVADNGNPPLSSQTTIHLDVAKVNHPPTLAPLADATIPELQLWSRTVPGEDLDLPTQTINYSLIQAPEGMAIDAGSGQITWIPAEAQGPGSYPVTVRVADPFGLYAEQKFTVQVTEANAAPVLAAIDSQWLVYGQSFSLQLAGSDSDLPANPLSYRLVAGPTNAMMTSTGLLTWTPLRKQAPSTNVFQVALSDGILSVTNTFSVEVLDLIVSLNEKETTNSATTLPPAVVNIAHSKADWLVFYSLDGQPPDAAANFYLGAFALEQSATVWPMLYSPDFSQAVMGLPVRLNLLKKQSIAFAGGSGLAFQGGPVAIGAAASSGLPVSLAVLSGPARLESGQLIATGGGLVRVRATQAGDDTWGAATAELELVAAPAAQSIAWTALPELSFGAGPVPLQATASSGLPVTYTVVSGPAAVNGGQLLLTGAGAVVLRAAQPGSVDFLPASADLAANAAKASQTVEFAASSTQVYTAAPLALRAEASSGLPVVFEVLSGPATVSGNQLTLTGVGPVVLRASQAGNGDYEAAPPRDQTMTVVQAPQTIQFTAVGAKTYGDGPVALAAHSSSGLPVTYRLVSGPGSLVGEGLAFTGAGTVAVEAAQAGSALYLPAAASQTVVVAQAPQKILFTTLADRPYSTNLVALAATADSGLPATFRLVSGPALVTASQLRLTGVGGIAVAADQGGDANWLAAVSVTNRFTVGRGEQTINFAPISGQVQSGQTILLAATSSVGLSVAFTVLSGPAMIIGNKLTVLGPGSITVRAINPGSPLYLGAQADQTIGAARLATLIIGADRSLNLEIRAPEGAKVVIESTTDLAAWAISQQLTGQGVNSPIPVQFKPTLTDHCQFWRVRIP